MNKEQIAINKLKSKREEIRRLANMNVLEEDMEQAFNIAQGFAWAYHAVGFISKSETLKWIEIFSEACEGR